MSWLSGNKNANSCHVSCGFEEDTPSSLAIVPPRGSGNIMASWVTLHGGRMQKKLRDSKEKPLGGGGTHVYWQYRYVRPLNPLFTPCQPFQSISFSLPDVPKHIRSFSLTNPFLWYAVEISVLKTPISC